MITVQFTDDIENITATEHLYQWDVGKILNIKGLNVGSPKVHFTTKGDETALVVQSELVNGDINAVIPDKVLQSGKAVTAYIYLEAGVSKYTIKTITIPVIARVKPNDYVETNTQDVTVTQSYFEVMNERVNTLENVKASKEELAVERARITALAKLGEGSTTGDAELVDGRTDYTGKTWSNIGEHIRGVSSQLSGEIDDLNDAVFTYTEKMSNVDIVLNEGAPHGQIGNVVNFANNNRAYATFVPLIGRKYKINFNQIGNDYGLHAIFICDSDNKILNIYDGTTESLSKWTKFELDIDITEPTATIVYVASQDSANINVRLCDIEKTDKISPLEKTVCGLELKTNNLENDFKETTGRKKSKILLCFDNATNILTDGRHSLLSEFGYKYTFAVKVMSDLINSSPSKSDVKTLLEYGCDVGIYNSANIPTSSDFGNDSLDWETYVETGIKCAEKVGVFNPVAWFAMQNRTGEALNRVLKKHGFKCCRGYIYGTYEPTGNVIKNWSYEDFIVKTAGLYPSTKNSVLSELNSAIEEGGDYCILTHEFHETTEDAEQNYGCTEQDYRDVLNNIKTFVDSGKAEVVTFREWYNGFYPIDGCENDYNRLLKYFGFLIN